MRRLLVWLAGWLRDAGLRALKQENEELRSTARLQKLEIELLITIVERNRKRVEAAARPTEEKTA